MHLTDRLHQNALDKLIEADKAWAIAPSQVTEPHWIADVDRALVQACIGDPLGLRLASLDPCEQHSGMTDRARWTLAWENDPAGKGPSAIFAKGTPQSAAHRVMLSVLHMDEAEAQFYNQVAKDLDRLVPRCFLASSFGGGRSLILLEDIEAAGCQPFWQGYDCTIAHARAVAICLASIHAKFWQSPRLGEDLSWIRPRSLRYGNTWLMQEHDQTRLEFLRNPPREHVGDHALAALEQWHGCHREMLAQWSRMPQTLLHGDSHLGNTFSRPDGSAGYYDWQVVFSGPGLRDLSYFLMSALTAEQRASHEREIFDVYVGRLEELGVIIDREQAWSDYTLFVFDRWDATIMAWVHGTYNHAPAGQIRMFRTIASAIEDHDVARRLKLAVG